MNRATFLLLPLLLLPIPVRAEMSDGGSSNTSASSSSSTTAIGTGSPATGASTNGNFFTSAPVTTPARSFSSGDLATGTVVSAGGVFTPATPEATALSEEVSRTQRQFLVEETGLSRPDISQSAQVLGNVQTFRNLEKGGVATFTSNLAPGNGVTTLPFPVGGTTTVSTGTPFQTPVVQGRVSTNGAFTSLPAPVPVNNPALPPALVSLEQNRPAAGTAAVQAQAQTQVLVGPVIFVDTPRNEITVRDESEGSNHTFVVSSDVIAKIEEGALVKIEHRQGSDVAESVVVKKKSQF
jgi:hypothetical protein